MKYDNCSELIRRIDDLAVLLSKSRQENRKLKAENRQLKEQRVLRNGRSS